MGEERTYNDDRGETWTGGSFKHISLPVQSDPYWQHSTFVPSICAIEAELSQQSLVLFPTSDGFWDGEAIHTDIGYIPRDMNACRTLPYDSESISSGSSTQVSPLEGVLETQSLDFHAPPTYETYSHTQSNQIDQIPISESARQPPTKPRWTTSQQPPKSSLEQFAMTAPQQISNRARPPILNSEPSFRHNLVERKYRSKLNNEYEALLNVLPPTLVAEVNEARRAAKQPEKSISKSEVLGLAKDHIEMLEKEGMALEMQRRTLTADLERMKEIWLSSLGHGGN